MSIPKVFIDQVLEQTNIVDVIGRRLPLTKKGNNYWSLCPFHDDNNPSMAVNEDKQFFYCFVCQESGNAIHFLREYEGLDFVDAVETLASSLGLEVPYERTPQENFSSDLLDSAVSFYANNLKSDEASHAKDYLKARGITGAVAKKFNLGYAPNSWDTLFKQAHKKYNHQEIEESGLFIEKEKGFYDRFRDRIIFPIRNIKGQFIGLGGRIIEAGEPKYLNSPETKLFNKSNELFGLFEAKDSKNTDTLIVVEGYMDVIGLYQHGIKNAVASSGTAFTQEQLRKILSYTNTIYIVFDGDEAGYKASWRAVENALSLLREDTRINFIFLESGEDPDSYVRKNGKEAFMNLAKNSMTFSDYFLDTIKNQDDLSSIEGRSVVAKFALPLVNKITNATLKEAYVNEISNICDLDFAKLIKGEKKNIVPATIKEQNTETKSSSVLRKSILNIFMSLIQHPKLASSGEFNQIRSNSRFSFLNEVKDIYIQNHDISASVLMEKISNDKIKNIFGEALVSEIQLSESDASSMLKDCIDFISQNESEREEVLKEKYSMQELSSAEKRELQQIILKKDRMSQEEAALIKNLSSK